MNDNDEELLLAYTMDVARSIGRLKTKRGITGLKTSGQLKASLSPSDKRDLLFDIHLVVDRYQMFLEISELGRFILLRRMLLSDSLESLRQSK